MDIIVGRCREEPCEGNSVVSFTARCCYVLALSLHCHHAQSQEVTGLKVCRVKNKFLLAEAEVQDGYRDIALNVLYQGPQGLRIIGEIQVESLASH